MSERNSGDPAGQRFQSSIQTMKPKKPLSFEETVAALAQVPKAEADAIEAERPKKHYKQPKSA